MCIGVMLAWRVDYVIMMQTAGVYDGVPGGFNRFLKVIPLPLKDLEIIVYICIQGVQKVLHRSLD